LLAVVIIILTGFVEEAAKLKFDVIAPSAILYWVFLKGLYLLLGIVIEGQRVISFFKRRALKLNWILLGLFILLAFISFSPADLSIVFGFLVWSKPLFLPEVNTALNILAGIFLVRSFVDGSNDPKRYMRL